RIGLYHLDNGAVEVLPHMEHGKNINPVWAPDGRSIAFVSDRTGISDIYLYDFGDHNLYQLTDVFTGVTGITPLSPALSWARQADRLAFAYYEDGDYNVYGVDNPRSLRHQPYQEPATPPVTSLLAATRRDTTRSGTPAGAATLAFAGAVNGRLSEAQVLAAYINQAHRLNWATGFTQEPYYFYQPTTIQAVAPDTSLLTVGIRRFVIRDGFVQAYYPFSRFSRVELGMHAVNISDAVLQQQYLVDQAGFIFAQSDLQTKNNPSITYVSPSLALVHDNALFGYVGPFAGSRYRVQFSPNFGDWQFLGGLADWRRYFFARPFT